MIIQTAIVFPLDQIISFINPLNRKPVGNQQNISPTKFGERVLKIPPKKRNNNFGTESIGKLNILRVIYIYIFKYRTKSS